MINARIHLLIKHEFIQLAASIYAGAKLKEDLGCGACEYVNTSKLRSKGDYYKEAVQVINQGHSEYIAEYDLSPITLKDLERCWRIMEGLEAVDSLGLIYVWVIRHIALYAPNKHGVSIKNLNLDESKIDQLFKDFISWVERTDRTGALCTSPTRYAYIDEISAIFETVLKEFGDSSSYVGNLIKDSKYDVSKDTIELKHHIKVR